MGSINNRVPILTFCRMIPEYRSRSSFSPSAIASSGDPEIEIRVAAEKTNTKNQMIRLIPGTISGQERLIRSERNRAQAPAAPIRMNVSKNPGKRSSEGDATNRSRSS